MTRLTNIRLRIQTMWQDFYDLSLRKRRKKHKYKYTFKRRLLRLVEWAIQVLLTIRARLIRKV